MRYVACIEERKASKRLTGKSVGKRSPRMAATVLLIFHVCHSDNLKPYGHRAKNVRNSCFVKYDKCLHDILAGGTLM
jgi:hypothetical protein